MLLNVPVHWSFGLLGELCLLKHTAGHGPMNQAAISSVSACFCSTALLYPQAAAFTPFCLPIHLTTVISLADGHAGACLPSPCNNAATACADGISAVELSVMNAITEHPELHYILQELIIFMCCVYRWSNAVSGLLYTGAQSCYTIEVASSQEVICDLFLALNGHIATYNLMNDCIIFTGTLSHKVQIKNVIH